jgi:hypothetical protein
MKITQSLSKDKIIFDQQELDFDLNIYDGICLLIGFLNEPQLVKIIIQLSL